MIISFTNVIGAIQSLVKKVITDNLKMWLGFETSQHLGLEQVINGDFSTDSDWNLGTGWDIDEANNKATHTGTGGIIKQSLSDLIVGKDYVASVTLNSIGDTSLSNTSFQIRNNADTISVAQLLSSSGDILPNSINYLTLKFNATQVNHIIRVFSEDDIFVTDFSIKQLTQITPDKSDNNNVGELFTGKALEFDGNNDVVVFSFTTPVKSAVFWVKPLDTGLENILTFGGAFASTKAIRSNSNVISTLGLSSVSVYVNGVQGSSVPLNEWSRVVVNFDLVTPTELRFGYAFNSYGYIQLSDVQLYNENLSTDDIAYDYANPQNLVTYRSGTSIGLSNLKGYWHLSEGTGSTTYDSSGEGNNGTINGATYELAQPRIPQLGMMNFSKDAVATGVTLIPNPNNTSQDILGNAVRDRLNSFNLDGVGYASVANNNSIKPTNALSIECWIKTSDVSVTSKYISDAESGTTRFFLMQTLSKARFQIDGTFINSAANLTDNTWHYIAGTWDGSTMKLYVDERTPVTIAKSGTITYDSDDLYIGSRSGTSEYYDGLISDVRLYDRALSATEVENNYNAGLSAHS